VSIGTAGIRIGATKLIGYSGEMTEGDRILTGRSVGSQTTRAGSAVRH